MTWSIPTGPHPAHPEPPPPRTRRSRRNQRRGCRRIRRRLRPRVRRARGRCACGARSARERASGSGSSGERPGAPEDQGRGRHRLPHRHQRQHGALHRRAAPEHRGVRRLLEPGRRQQLRARARLARKGRRLSRCRGRSEARACPGSSTTPSCATPAPSRRSSARCDANGGGDEPESLLDALYTVAAMEAVPKGSQSEDPAKWRYRSDAARVVIVFTDASFKETMSIPAGEGRLAPGRRQPGDGQPHHPQPLRPQFRRV